MYSIIAAVCQTTNLPDDCIGGIGLGGNLVCKLKEDMEYFKTVTKGNVIVMGSGTYKSIGKALPGRENVVLSKTMKSSDDVTVFKTIKKLDSYLVEQSNKGKKIFIIGGESLYRYFISSKNCQEIYITEIYKKYKCDVYFPSIPSKFKLVSTSQEYERDGVKFRFLKYKRALFDQGEKPFLDLGKYILQNGHVKKNRTGIDTVSTFSYQLRLDISNGVPLLTTKRVPWKTCIEELLWFLRGETDAKILQEKNIKIWDGNTSREFLDNMGFYDVQEGELRKGYGHQIRRYGEKGVDQLAYVENLLKTDPDSRRIMWNLWNASDLDEMVLTPCFLKDNMVITKRGYSKVQDVTTDDFLLTHTGDYKKCLNVQKKIYEDTIYTIQTVDNPMDITCTKEHLFYASIVDDMDKKQWIKAEDLLPSKHVLCLKVNTQSQIPKDFYCPDNSFDNTWYLAGYLNEDCKFLKESRIKISISHTKLKELLPYLSIYKIYKSCSCEDHENCLDLQKLVLKDEKLYSLLRKLNRNTEFLQGLPKEKIRIFLKGFESFTRQLKTPQKVLLFTRLYAKLGHKAIFERKKDTWQLVFVQEDVVKDYIYYPIKNIFTKKGKEAVYNFETDVDHTYTINNTIVHNCHNQVQFYVKNKKYLSAQLYCRSSDYFLGLPFNIFSYTVLIYILAKKCDLIPDELVVTLGDAHIYSNHIEQVKELLTREKRALPMLLLDDSIKNKKYEEITIDDFNIVGYFPQKTIKADMAV